MRKTKQILFSIAAGLASAPLAYWVLGELIVRYEMMATDMTHRSELATDLGFGLLLFLVVLPATLICVATVSWVVWRWLNSKGLSSASA